MCGIVWVKKARGQSAQKAVLKRFQKQKSRGTSGFGYVAIENGVVVSVQRAKTEDEIVRLMSSETASEILLHHRFPTSTPNYVGATHPFIVSDPRFEFDYIVVHNGVVTNCHELKKKHEGLGIEYMSEYKSETKTKTTVTKSLVFSSGFVEHDDETYSSETSKSETGYNDSESLAVELALVCEQWKEDVETRGGLSVIFYQLNKDGHDGIIGASVNKMFYASNNGRPLVLETHGKINDKGGMVALKSEGNGQSIKIDTLHSVYYDEDGAHLDSIKIKLGTWFEPVQNTNVAKVGFNSSQNYHQYDKAKDRVDKDDEESPLIKKGSFSRAYEDRNKYLDKDYDDIATESERALVAELEHEEGVYWQNKSRDIIDEIADMNVEVKKLRAQIRNGYDSDVSMELDMYLEEITKKQNELRYIQEKLIELDMPVPSQFTPVIVY